MFFEPLGRPPLSSSGFPPLSPFLAEAAFFQPPRFLCPQQGQISPGFRMIFGNSICIFSFLM
nr:MAG TPA: hypothetical protein [Caudoviricetes sp.]